MGALRKSVAETVLAGLALTPPNRAVADHWLSLWHGDALPSRNDVRPGKLKAQLPNLLVFDVVPGKSVTVRLAGTGLRQVLSREITGEDWLAMTPAHHRNVRLKNLSDVAQGAVLVTHRRTAMVAGADSVNEEIALPFAPEPDGVHPVMAHVDWKLDRLTKLTAMAKIDDASPDYRLLPLG